MDQLSQIGIDASRLVPSYLRNDPMRDERRCVLRVKFNGFGSAVCEIGGQLVLAKRDARNKPIFGEAVEVTVYESDAKRAQGLIETELDAIRSARTMSLNDVKRAVQQATTGSITPDMLGGEPSTWPEEAQTVYRRSAASLEGSFCAITGRGIMPLESIEVVEEFVSPVTESSDAAMTAQANNTAAIIAAVAPMIAKAVADALDSREKARK